MSPADTVTGMVHTRALLAGMAVVTGSKALPLAVSSLQSEIVMFWAGKLAGLLTILRLEFAATGSAPLMNATVYVTTAPAFARRTTPVI